MPHDSDDEDAEQMLQSARFRHVPVFDERADAITGLVDTDAWRLATSGHTTTTPRRVGGTLGSDAVSYTHQTLPTTTPV